MRREFTIYKARRDEFHQGWVWLCEPSLPPRAIVRITNPVHKKSLYCEALQLDQNYLSDYDLTPRKLITDPRTSLVLHGWYRKKLGIDRIDAPVALSITRTRTWYAKFRACIDHPQIIVRQAMGLGVLGVALGVLPLLADLCKFAASVLQIFRGT